MSNLAPIKIQVPSMSKATVDRVYELQASLSHLPKIDITTHHVLHAGMYSRTVTIQPGSLIVGVLIKVPTTLVINGDVSVYLGDQTLRLTGYNVLPASAHRKQAFFAHTETSITMSFVTDATSIEQAEDQFTDEAGALVSRHEDAINEIIITGE